MSKLKVPARGWVGAFDPCSECLSLVERESASLVQTGQQVDCYACGNRLTMVLTEERSVSPFDIWSPFCEPEEGHERAYEVVELFFHQRHYNAGEIQRWLAGRGVEGFDAPIRKKMDWAAVARESGVSEDSVLAFLDEGVVGRCLLKVK